MDYINIAGLASGSLGLGSKNVWIGYSEHLDIPSVVVSNYKIMQNNRSEVIDGNVKGDYLLLEGRSLTAEESQDAKFKNCLVTREWVQQLVNRDPSKQLDISNYVGKEEFREFENSIRERINSFNVALNNLSARVTVNESAISRHETDININRTDINDIKSYIDWSDREDVNASNGLIKLGLILYGGRATGWDDTNENT